MKHVVSFIEGMDKDTSFNKYPNTRYLHSENFRFIYDEENSLGILTNDVGDKNVITLPGTLLGYTTIRDTLVLFIVRYEPHPNLNIFEIYQIPEEKVLDSDQINIGSYLKLSSIDFGYTVDTRVKAIGRYESENIEKLYWTDGISFKYCNLRDANLAAQDISKFEAYPINNLATVTVTGLTTGSLRAGKVQYGYQLYNINGAATGVNGLSRLINITSSTDGHTRDFKGDLPGVNTNKGCTVRVDNIDRSFERIRLYRIFYTDFVQVPEVYLVDEVEIKGESMTFTDLTAIGIMQVAFEELIAMSTDLLFNTLETKNNILFVGDVTEKVFDLEINMSVQEFTEVPIPTKDITFTVRDSNNNPLRLARVIISTNTSSFTRPSDVDGIALITNVPDNVYDVEVSLMGYKTHTGAINTVSTTSQTIILETSLERV